MGNPLWTVLAAGHILDDATTSLDEKESRLLPILAPRAWEYVRLLGHRPVYSLYPQLASLARAYTGEGHTDCALLLAALAFTLEHRTFFKNWLIAWDQDTFERDRPLSHQEDEHG